MQLWTNVNIRMQASSSVQHIFNTFLISFTDFIAQRFHLDLLLILLWAPGYIFMLSNFCSFRTFLPFMLRKWPSDLRKMQYYLSEKCHYSVEKHVEWVTCESAGFRKWAKGRQTYSVTVSPLEISSGSWKPFAPKDAWEWKHTHTHTHTLIYTELLQLHNMKREVDLQKKRYRKF